MRGSKLLAIGAAALTWLTPSPIVAARAPVPAPPSRLERLARILELEDARSSGSGELERSLRDPDPGVRRRAALAAGRLADPALVPALVNLMNDGEPQVRRMTAFALGLARDRGAVERLLLAMKLDTDSGVRGRSAEALGRIGDARVAADVARLVVATLPKTISRMTVRGDDPSNALDTWAEQRFALLALARLRDAAAAQLVLLVDGRPRFDWWAASWLAMRLASPALRPALVAAAASDEVLSRVYAAQGLAQLKDAASFDLLVGMVRDKSPQVAAAALAGLGTSGDRRATAAAAAALSSPSDVVRHEALRALTALPPDPELRSRVVVFAAERDPWLRAAAFPALAHTSPEDFTLVLSGMDPDPSPDVRAAIAGALGSLGSEAGVSVLYAMLKDEDARVVASVLAALRRARGAAARETLVQSLTQPDLGARAAAAREIAALGAKGLTQPLLAAWQRGLADDGSVEARLAALDALASADDDAAHAALERIAREDPARALRVAATRASTGGGQAAGPLPPEIVLRPPADWRLAMIPYDPRPERPLFTPRVFFSTRAGRVEIRPDVVEAPLAAASFVALARRGFYDGLAFDALDAGRSLLGGCPRGDGNGGPGYTLRDELGDRAFARGAVGLVRSAPDTAGSRFMIALAPQPQLDGETTLVGWVAAGMDVVDRLRPGDVIERVEVWTGE